MPDDLQPVNAKFTSLGTQFWSIEKGSPKANTPACIVLKPNGEPLIKTLNFNDEVEYHSLEELWALESGIIMDRFGRPNRLGSEALYYCAAVGSEIIRKVWSENGYSNKGETARSTKVKNQLSPVSNSKVNRKASLEKDKVLPTLEFGIHSNTLGWALKVEGARESLTHVKWNDLEAIKDLALRVLDKKYCLSMYALVNPDVSRKLMANKERYRNEVILYKFLPQYSISGYSQAIMQSYSKDIQNITYKILGDKYLTKPMWNIYELMNPDKYNDTRVKVYNEITLRISSNHVNPWPVENVANYEAWVEAEQALWESFVSRVEGMGEKVISLPVAPEISSSLSKVVVGQSLMLRKIVVAKDEEIYREYVDEPGVWTLLMRRANEYLASQEANNKEILKEIK